MEMRAILASGVPDELDTCPAAWKRNAMSRSRGGLGGIAKDKLPAQDHRNARGQAVEPKVAGTRHKPRKYCN
jgi:hypothetical protein